MHRNRLVLQERPPDTPFYFFSEQQELEFDLTEEFKVSESLQAITNVGEIGDASVFGFSLLDTPKHNWIFNRYRHFSVLNGAMIPVHALAGGHLLRHDMLLMTQVVDGAYECELVIGEKHWLANELLLNELDYGEVFMDYDNLNDIIFQNDIYTENVAHFYMPRIYYNQWQDDTTARIEDFRPLPFLSFMMFEGFRQLGWILESDFLNSDRGRRIICYVLKKDFYRHSRVGQGSEVTMTHPTLTDTVNSTYTLSYNAATGNPAFYIAPDTYISARNVPITLQVVFGCDFRRFTAGTITPTLQFQKFNIDTSIWEIISNFPFTYDVSPNFIRLDYETSMTFQPNEQFRVVVINGAPDMRWENLSVQVLFKAEQNTVGTEKSPFLLSNDTVTVADTIEPYDFRDLVRGVAHFGYIFHTDFNTKKVTMQPLEEQTVDGVTYTGFLSGEEIDLRDYYVEGSTKMPYSTRENRYLRFAFAKSSDGYIESENLDTEENRLFSNTFDMLEGVNQSTETSENPFFEPTPNIDNWDGYRMPVIGGEHDTLNDGYATEIKPRLFYCRYTTQMYFDDVNGPFHFNDPWLLEGRATNLFGAHPFCWQVQDFQIFNSNVTPPQHLTYSNNDSVLTDTLLAYINNLLVMPTIEVIVKISWLHYDQMDFKDYIYLCLDNGKEMHGILREKRDFHTETEIPTVLVMTPRNNGELFFLEGDTNNPDILHG